MDPCGRTGSLDVADAVEAVEPQVAPANRELVAVESSRGGTRRAVSFFVELTAVTGAAEAARRQRRDETDIAARRPFRPVLGPLADGLFEPRVVPAAADPQHAAAVPDRELRDQAALDQGALHGGCLAKISPTLVRSVPAVPFVV